MFLLQACTSKPDPFDPPQNARTIAFVLSSSRRGHWLIVSAGGCPCQCSQDDFREYRCWQVLLDGQHCVTELQGIDGEQQQQQQRLAYERTINALYPLVSFEGRWMLDINARYDTMHRVCGVAQPTN